jgi:hypothetical protein
LFSQRNCRRCRGKSDKRRALVCFGATMTDATTQSHSLNLTAITVSLPLDLITALDRRAELDGRSRSGLVRRILGNALAEPPQDVQP